MRKDLRFPVTKPKYLEGVDLTINFKDDELVFSDEQIYALVRSTGLRSKKRRHIAKRFKLIIVDAVKDMVSTYETE